MDSLPLWNTSAGFTDGQHNTTTLLLVSSSVYVTVTIVCMIVIIIISVTASANIRNSWQGDSTSTALSSLGSSVTLVFNRRTFLILRRWKKRPPSAAVISLAAVIAKDNFPANFVKLINGVKMTDVVERKEVVAEVLEPLLAFCSILFFSWLSQGSKDSHIFFLNKKHHFRLFCLDSFFLR